MQILIQAVWGLFRTKPFLTKSQMIPTLCSVAYPSNSKSKSAGDMMIASVPTTSVRKRTLS